MRRKRSVFESLRLTPAVWVIVLFNIVGIIGFSVHALQPLFMKIVPWYLLLMGVLVIINHKPLNGRFFVFFLVVYLIASAVEWVGVHKGWFFGRYHYGQTLGWKFKQVPLLIGLNWFLLVYSAGVLMQFLRLKNDVARMVTGAAVLLLLDLLMEPVATRFGYWYWAGGRVPWFNYAGWFLLGCLLLFIFEKCRFGKQGIVAPVFLVMQFVFFGSLIL